MATTSDIGSVIFSEPKTTTSGKFKKISILNSDGKKILIETEECFSWGVQKSKLYESYSIPLVFKSEDRTAKILKEIFSKCKEHLPGKDLSKCFYENPARGTITIYPQLRYFAGKFSTGVYEGDTEVAPLKYLDVKCSTRVVICPECILLGDKTRLLVKVYKAEVSERKEPKKRLISKQH